MYLLTQNYFQNILTCALLYFSILYGVVYAADRSHPNNRTGNNTVYIMIENSLTTTAMKNKAPVVSVQYSTQKIDCAHCLYSMITTHNLCHLRSFQSFTVEKMKNSEESSITFVTLAPERKVTSVAVRESDSLLISNIHENPIIIEKKNAVTNQRVKVAEFNSK